MKPEKKPVHSDEAPKGRGPFPQALRYGNLLFVSGQGPLDPERSAPIDGSFEDEVEQTLANLRAVVKGAGCDLSDALKLTIYLADLANIPRFNEIYARHFPEPRPARTLVQAGLRGIQVEIDAMFACEDSSQREEERPAHAG